MSTKTDKVNGFTKFINGIERVGNKLPHPFFLFTYLCIIVCILSLLLAGTEAVYTAANSDGTTSEVAVEVVNLLSPKYIETTLKNWVKIYTNFSPLGLVMVMMLAIGVAQESGMFDAVMRKTLLGAPAMIVTFVLAVVGVCANVASSSCIVLGVTIGAALFSALGRNPILGALTGYTAAHGGFSANLLPSGTDVNLSGITESVCNAFGIQAVTHPLINYTFLIAATFGTAIAVTFVTEKIMPGVVKYGVAKTEMNDKVTDEENRGLKFCGIATLIYVVIIAALTIPTNGFFRNAEGKLLPSSPFINSIVPILFFLFIVSGSAYGIGAGTIKKASDVPKFMGKGITGILSFLVMALPAALFIQMFGDSNLAVLLSVKGANMLQALGFTGVPLAVCFVLLCAFCNLFMTSASAKWLIFAPVFVPMFYQLGFTPALTQLCYRIGDSFTNPIAPINAYLPIALGVINSYKAKDDPEIGLGTLISMTLPYALAIGVAQIIILVIFMLLGLPIGPGTPLYV